MSLFQTSLNLRQIKHYHSFIPHEITIKTKLYTMEYRALVV